MSERVAAWRRRSHEARPSVNQLRSGALYFVFGESIGGKAQSTASVSFSRLDIENLERLTSTICTTFSNGIYYDSEFEHCKDLAWPTAVFFCAHTLSSLRQYADSSVSETKSMQSSIPNCMWTRLLYNLDPGSSRDDCFILFSKILSRKYARSI